MSAKEKLLDAFEDILISQGENAATLDAVAQKAGVSKGGLLYHFPSKTALVTGLTDRLEERMNEDISLMQQAPGGVAAYYIRTHQSLTMLTPALSLPPRSCLARILRAS
ncbi:TetR/AcrR family transcriptional regulator [Corynebacterium belfantii]|uniref:TetR/AcrR family transcriptional regulator n=1 Tax=Corynebacterium belfantii TaxID=2014537 RepID=UPI00353113D8